MRRFFVVSSLLLASIGICVTFVPTRVPLRVQAAAVDPSDPCFLPPSLFGDTDKPLFKEVPPAHAVNPSDCPFYQPAWQEFLYATKPLPHSHLPNFLSFQTFDEIFAKNPTNAIKSDSALGLMLRLEPRDIERANSPTEAHQRLLDQAASENSAPPEHEPLEDTVQAAFGKSVGGALIDQHGHFIYYAIHANPEMVQFLRNNKLTGQDVAAHLPSASPFASLGAETKQSPSLVEYKSAWMIVDGPSAAPLYYVTKARVPVYSVDADGKLAPVVYEPHHTVQTRSVWVALLALHVVFTLPGHPELIWSTFEHVGVYNGIWQRDNAPAASANPTDGSPVSLAVNRTDYPLYKANTPPEECNKFIQDPAALASHWDQSTQSFTKGGLLQTSVFRMYPGSKSVDKPPFSEDADVQAVNNNATRIFTDSNEKKLEGDKRQYYRLVGAIWMDKPAHLKVGMAIANPPGVSTDDDKADVAGEDGLGSTAMESFTEADAPNCFSCHDTQRISILHHPPPVPASNVNLSHLISKFVSTLPPSK